MSLISSVLLLPLLGVFILLFVPSWKVQLIRNIALNTSLITFLISLLLWIEFDNSTSRFQFFENYNGLVDKNTLFVTGNDFSYSGLYLAKLD